LYFVFCMQDQHEGTDMTPILSRKNLFPFSVCIVPGHDDTMPGLKESIGGEVYCFLGCLWSCPCHFLYFLYIYLLFECKNMKEQLRRPFFSRNNLSLSSICFVPGHDDTMP
jgi:hypothetical protein